MTYINTIASVMGLSNDITLEEEGHTRLTLTNNKLSMGSINSDLQEVVWCENTAHLLASQLVDQQLVEELEGVKALLDGILHLLDIKQTNELLEACLGRVFIGGNTMASDNSKLIICIKNKLTSRPKRSSLI